MLGAGDALSATLAPVVRDTFNVTERKIDDRQHHPVPRADREKSAPVIEAMYAAADARVVYVEAAREYRVERDPAQCRAVAFGGGWFARGDDRRYTPLQTYVTVLNCDRDGASYMLPLGIVQLSGRDVLAGAVFRLGRHALRGRRDQSQGGAANPGPIRRRMLR